MKVLCAMRVPNRDRLHPGAITIVVLCILCGLVGCRYLYPLHYFDATTYRNLTETKPLVVALYETFTDEVVKSERIEAVHIRLAQIYEYEKGKGEKNIETTRQVRIIKVFFIGIPFHHPGPQGSRLLTKCLHPYLDGTIHFKPVDLCMTLYPAMYSKNNVKSHSYVKFRIRA